MLIVSQLLFSEAQILKKNVLLLLCFSVLAAHRVSMTATAADMDARTLSAAIDKDETEGYALCLGTASATPGTRSKGLSGYVCPVRQFLY